MATCANHPQTTAAAYCRTCGKPLCTTCERDVRGVIYCEECVAARMQGTMPPAGSAAGAAGIPPLPNVDSLPNSGLATFLGMIPGVGAMYNGQFLKAIAHIVIFITLSMAADRSDFFGIFVFLFWLYMVIDARKTARARIHGEPLPDILGIGGMVGELQAPGVKAAAGTAFQQADATVSNLGQRQTKIPIAAIVLIGLGVLFLLNNMGLFAFHFFGVFWPVVLIGVGGWLIVKRWERSSCPCLRCRLACMTGPVMLFTFGVLMLLDRIASRYLYDSRGLMLHNTFPVLFIVFGGLRLAQANASNEGHIAPPLPAAHDFSPPPVPPAPGGAHDAGVNQEVNRG